MENKNFRMEIEQREIFSQMLYLVQYGDRKLDFPNFIDNPLEIEDYLEELKDILIYYLTDNFEDEMNKYLNEVMELDR